MEVSDYNSAHLQRCCGKKHSKVGGVGSSGVVGNFLLRERLQVAWHYRHRYR